MYPIRRIYPAPDTLFESFLDEFFNSFPVNTSHACPIHHVIENDKEFIVEAVLAGIKKEDMSIDIENDMLIIKAERKEVKDTNYNRKQTFFGKYERSFKLPDIVDVENINASLTDGILKVTVPKLEKSAKLSKKKIEIN